METSPPPEEVNEKEVTLKGFHKYKAASLDSIPIGEKVITLYAHHYQINPIFILFPFKHKIFHRKRQRTKRQKRKKKREKMWKSRKRRKARRHLKREYHPGPPTAVPPATTASW